MTKSQKQAAIQKTIDWLVFRQTQGFRSVRRNAVQAAFENITESLTGSYKVQVLTSAQMNMFAQAVGGTYRVEDGEGTIYC